LSAVRWWFSVRQVSAAWTQAASLDNIVILVCLVEQSVCFRYPRSYMPKYQHETPKINHKMNHIQYDHNLHVHSIRKKENDQRQTAWTQINTSDLEYMIWLFWH
jgi:hypothetical protein